MPSTRSVIDQSHSELDLRMTEGDPLQFLFWVRDAAAWAAASFTCSVRKKQDPTTELAAPTVVVAAATGPDPDTSGIMGLNVDITNAAVVALTAVNGPTKYAWSMRQTGGLTRFGGWLEVLPV